MFSGFRTTIINIIFPQSSIKSTSDLVDWDWVMKLLRDKQLPNINALLVDTQCDQTLIDVSIQEQPHWVGRLPSTANRNANTTLIEICHRDDIRNKLLVLGEPGAGKTTALLRLSKQLIEKAISDPETLIPVVFELSTWKNNQDIKSWLIEQLYYLYNGDPRTKCYEQWLEGEFLLPLMDGLDELGLDRQRQCTEKLNEFASYYSHLVVFCGTKQFKTVGINLDNLRGAVYLNPLSDSQIQNYFNSFGYLDLWEKIQTNLPLQSMLEPTKDGDPGLLRVPLFVSLVANINVSNQQQHIDNKESLLDEYINRQLSSDKRNSDRTNERKNSDWAYKTVNNEPELGITKKRLRWLANNLKDNNKVDFLIENLQPSLIDSKSHYYSLIFWFILIFSLSIVTLICQKIFSQIDSEIIYWGKFDLESFLLFSMIIGLSRLIVWLVRGRRQASWLTTEAYKIDKIEVVEDFQLISDKNVFNPIRSNFLLKVLLIIVIILSIAWVYDASIYPYRIFPFILAATILNCIIYGVNLLKQELNLKNRENPNQGIINSFKNYIKITILIIVIYVLFGSQLPSIFLPVGLIVSFVVCGGKAWLQHLSLRIVLWRSGLLPWNLAQFLNYCVERRLLLRVGGSYRFLHRELLDHFANIRRPN
jgi:hypothetical protein